jgi:hypothetical protein
MITGGPNQPAPEQMPDLEEDLRHHGVTRVRADSFEVNGFRYTNPRDAIAEAKRHPKHRS